MSRNVIQITDKNGNAYAVKDASARADIAQLQNTVGIVPSGQTLQGQVTSLQGQVTSLQGEVNETVKFTSQSLTSIQKEQARENIDAADKASLDQYANLTEAKFAQVENAIDVLEPTATSEDVGKTLIAKIVENGKVSEYEFGTAGEGLTEAAKIALLNCLAHVAWIDEHGQDYYDALYNALYEPQPEPDVPGQYIQYDWIRLKQYSEAPNVYDEGSANTVNVAIYDRFNPMIKTSAYSDLNQLNFKATVGIMQPTVTLSGSPNSCSFGGGIADGETSRFGIYWHTGKQWIYLMMHGIERKIEQNLLDVNTIEIINGLATPSTVKINGVSHSFEWENSNVLNCPIGYFFNRNFLPSASTTYFGGVGTYTKVGVIEVSSQNDDVVSKLIPVVRKADSVIGVWDSVRKEFYTPDSPKYATIGNASCIYDVGNWE